MSLVLFVNYLSFLQQPNNAVTIIMLSSPKKKVRHQKFHSLSPENLQGTESASSWQPPPVLRSGKVCSKLCFWKVNLAALKTASSWLTSPSYKIGPSWRQGHSRSRLIPGLGL